MMNISENLNDMSEHSIYEKITQKIVKNVEIDELKQIELTFLQKDLQCRILELLDGMKSEKDPDNRNDIVNEIIYIIRSNLKSIDTVGHILDVLNFTVKCFFVDKPSIIEDFNLLVDVLMLMPESWTYDPVKIHLITKLIYEIVQIDFNNELFIITKIIGINKISYYVGLTLWWTCFFKCFHKKETHYYKMYSVDRFFNMISSIELNENANNLNATEFYQKLLLISIYQNFVILNERNKLETLNEEHHLYKDFFKVSEREQSTLQNWLINAKAHIEIHNRSSHSGDVLMLLELLELDLINTISKYDSHQASVPIQLNNNANSNAIDDNQLAADD